MRGLFYIYELYGTRGFWLSALGTVVNNPIGDVDAPTAEDVHIVSRRSLGELVNIFKNSLTTGNKVVFGILPEFWSDPCPQYVWAARKRRTVNTQ
jgi:hypothetical protein